MFPRLAEHYRSVIQDLVLSLQALANSLKDFGVTATCYSCGDGREVMELPLWRTLVTATW